MLFIFAIHSKTVGIIRRREGGEAEVYEVV